MKFSSHTTNILSLSVSVIPRTLLGEEEGFLKYSILF